MRERASPGSDPAPGDTALARVWDAPTRLAHWTLAAAFALAWVTSESEAWRPTHVRAGYVVAGVLAFRIVWGVVGTRWARFRSFAFGARAVRAYLLDTLRGRAPHFAGHSPLAAWAICAMLGLAALTVTSGFLAWTELAGTGVVVEVHEAVGDAFGALVLVHLAGVAVESVLQRQNLARGMVSGDKRARAGEAIAPRAGRWGVALLVAAVAGAVAGLGGLAARLGAW